MSERPQGFDRLLGYMTGRLADEPAGEEQPKEISREEVDRLRTQLTSHLMMFSELIAPVFDHADGIRADLERRGWSTQAAEQIALLWLINSMQTIIGGWSRK